MLQPRTGTRAGAPIVRKATYLVHGRNWLLPKHNRRHTRILVRERVTRLERRFESWELRSPPKKSLTETG